MKMSCSQFVHANVSTQRLMSGGQGNSLHEKSQCQPCYNEEGVAVSCSCQYDPQLFRYHQRRLVNEGLAPLSATSGGDQGMFVFGSDQSAFATQSSFPLDVKKLEAWRNISYTTSMYYPYELLSSYPFSAGYGTDINGIRRKNATRETTSTLKAWLNEHKKNPYPTKGEKIMLAIITRMTLTQVSTWFANARRRLKKDNKMTWESKNKGEDEFDDGEDEGSIPSKDGDEYHPDDSRTRVDGSATEEEDKTRQEHPETIRRVEERDQEIREDGDEKTLPDLNPKERPPTPPFGSQRNDRNFISPDLLPLKDGCTTNDSRVTPPLSDSKLSTTKPRIWSIVNTAISDKRDTSEDVHHCIPTITQCPTRASYDHLSQYVKHPFWFPTSVNSGMTSSLSSTRPFSVPFTPLTQPSSTRILH